MATNTFPSDWRDEPCFIVAIPKPLAPFVGGLLKILEQRGFWATAADYERGYIATVELEACIMATCLQDLMQLQEAQYRLLNTALMGVEYTTESEDPLVVTPPITPHINLDVHNQDSLMGRVDRLTQLLDNRLAGTETPLYDDTPGIKQQLQSIIDALGSDDADLTTIIETLGQIALLLG